MSRHRHPATCDAGRRHRRRLTVFVIAHPDDESMFFVPTIYHLVQQQQQQYQQQDDSTDSHSLNGGGDVWLVCLTSGNYNGLGTIRSQELHRTCKDILGIDMVILMNDEEGVFFDHPHQSWDVEKAAQCLCQTLQEALQEEHQQHPQQQAVQVIDFITFDELGVSGHVNHRDTYRTVKCLCEKQHQQQQQQQQHYQNEIDFPRCIAWTLETEQNIISKYLPWYSWILLLLSVLLSFFLEKCEPRSIQDGNAAADDDDAGSGRMVYRLHQPWINWNAMQSHASQFVWYRRLFVIFGSYTYVNVLNRIETMITHPQPLKQQQDEKQKYQ
jgi:N-acetylglucosaminylphosphatidylinositol deacetylase